LSTGNLLRCINKSNPFQGSDSNRNARNFIARSIIMKTLERAFEIFLFVVAASLLAVNTTHAAVSCHKINAKGVGQDLGGGITEAKIIGGGLLHGTTQGSFAITGGVPPVLSIAGTVTFTANKATLTVTVTGTFNVETGNFMASGPVTAATGKLAGATGTLVLDGIEDLTTGTFVEDVGGLICVDLAP
jgi:hypothetical protein